MRWSVVVPVYNEAAFLPATIASLAAQTVPFRLILVDNASTDGGIAAAREQIAAAGMVAEILEERTPGQVHALKRGIDAAATEFVAICDADTVYPANYLAVAERLFDRGGKAVVATSAYLVPEQAGGLKARLRVLKQRAVLSLLPRQNHVSGAAHCFRRDALVRSGGYDAAIWPFVLKDHELMQRVLHLGRQAHARDLWCVSSERRVDRKGVRWTLGERILYHATPFPLKDRLFHGLLARRFSARGQRDTVLRRQNWAAASSKA